MAMKATPDFNARLFEMRLERSRDDLFGMLRRLYGHRTDYERFARELIDTLRASWNARPERLKWRDMQRDLEPDWFQRPGMNGYVFCIDRFCGTLDKLPQKLDYLEDLGITCLHVMPCLKPRPGDSDGGFSVMDFRQVNPDPGTMDDIEAVTRACHERGMSVCIDLVLNHTSSEHEWARKARAGDGRYRDYYFMFPDDTVPKAYEATLAGILPGRAPRSFTFYEDMDRWVWTTFNEHQWDLNWSNPQVFLEMVRVMLFLANRGIDVLRLDAPAFLWKRMGTRCQSEPEVHVLLHALRAASRIAASAVIHLEETVAGPAETIPYLGCGEHSGKEGNLAYHNALMVHFWSALAARDTALMTHVLARCFPPVLPNATYATCLRCHDDIGWEVTDEDAGAVGISGAGHRAFLSDFYGGTFPGSFARGVSYQAGPHSGERRISGTCASLAGLEQALEAANPHEVDTAIDRILMGHALIASWGGIPLINMGDEIAALNDYSYRDGPQYACDSRWLHRPQMDWERVASLGAAPDSPQARVHAGIRQILARRAAVPGFHGKVPTEVLDTGRKGLFAFARRASTGPVICVFNFTEEWTGLPASWFASHGASKCHELLSDALVKSRDGGVALPPYARAWMT